MVLLSLCLLGSGLHAAYQLSPAVVKPLYFEPLYSGHLSIADTFSENQWCPLLRGFTVFMLIGEVEHIELKVSHFR